MNAVLFDYSADRLAARVEDAERLAASAMAEANEAREYTRRLMNEHCKELQALNDLWQHYDAEQRRWSRS